MDIIEHLHHTEIDGISIGGIHLYCCGRRTNAPDHSFGPAARDHFWFIYLREGSVIYEVGQRIWRLARGMLFVAFPNRRIHYIADPGSIWTIHWVSIDAPEMEDILARMDVTEENPIIMLEAPTAAERIFTSLLGEIPTDTVQSKFNCQSLVYSLLSLMTASTLPAYSERDSIDEAVLFMTNNYERPLTIAEVASAVGLDRSYFARQFRRRLGVAPAEWLLRYRLERAKTLMRTDLKICEIALSVGFVDSLYFSRRFRERFGISPTAYRKGLSW